MKLEILFFVFMFMSVSVYSATLSASVLKVCEPGKTREVDCNICDCNADGTAERCAYQACIPGVEKPRRRVCEPLADFKDDCNLCTCNLDGTTAMCTKVKCSPRIRLNLFTTVRSMNSTEPDIL